VVTVTNVPLPASGKVWVGSAGGRAALLGYSAATVAATGVYSADVAPETAGSGGFAFDLEGNLWVVGGSSADPPLAHYDAAALGTSGAKIPSATIDNPALRAGVPGPQAIALRGGALWVSMAGAGKVLGFLSSGLHGSVTSAPSMVIDGVSAPSGLAFDGAGNLWVANSGDGTLLRFDSATLSSAGAPITAALTITAQGSGAVARMLSSPSGLAFDGTGNLWVDYDGTLARLMPADLAGSGSKVVTPAVQIDLDVLALPLGIAFDEQGGLWFAYTAGKIARLDGSQLAASGSPTPSTIIESSDVGYAGWIALFPAPPTTPLDGRWYGRDPAP
jgi:streptogramin lyase